MQLQQIASMVISRPFSTRFGLRTAAKLSWESNPTVVSMLALILPNFLLSQRLEKASDRLWFRSIRLRALQRCHHSIATLPLRVVRHVRVTVLLGQRGRQRQRGGARPVLVVALGRHAHPVMVHVLVALRRPAHRRAPVNQLPYFGLLVGDVVGEFRLLEAGGGHSLVPSVAGSGALRRVG